ncbi:MAG: response regulator transcription factor [Fibrobacterales bacterium]
MSNEKILLVEDDANMAIALKFNLDMEGWDVDHVVSAEEAMALIPRNDYSLLILDIMLPGISGVELLKQFRSHNKILPVIMTSAKDSNEDIVEALKLGADDYITKPFDLKVFIAKVTAMMRSRKLLSPQADQQTPSKVLFANCWIDFTTSMAGNNEEEFRLSYKETLIMKLLVESKGTVVSRDDFWKKIWGAETSLNSRTLDNFMYQLRKRFEVNPSKPKHILKAHGEGYRFIQE